MKIVQILPAPEGLVAVYKKISGDDKGAEDSCTVVCLAVVEEMARTFVVGFVPPLEGRGKQSEFVPADQAAAGDEVFEGYEFHQDDE